MMRKLLRFLFKLSEIVRKIVKNNKTIQILCRMRDTKQVTFRGVIIWQWGEHTWTQEDTD